MARNILFEVLRQLKGIDDATELSRAELNILQHIKRANLEGIRQELAGIPYDMMSTAERNIRNLVGEPTEKKAQPLGNRQHFGWDYSAGRAVRFTGDKVTTVGGKKRPYHIIKGAGLCAGKWAAKESTTSKKPELAIYKTRMEAVEHAEASQP